ncbi:hypothetical protein DMB44_03205 [Thermoplasma sp. Kam2015]|uniref:hypothetical protein n=1 Tax=Thermoplasma sp. Kam2015 TaxID=2094122 RepID=UPI000D98578E|nr:hypothetical protein [Thermoplasma sp. Kam2015]PYB68628.1 hypothetical protein DMB44_03205 [Thermoplasma sp. Kam2015]
MKSTISMKGKEIIENAFHDYNNIRPHSTLDYYSPLQFLEKWNSDGSFREHYRNFLKNLKDGYRRRRNNYYRRSRMNIS